MNCLSDSVLLSILERTISPIELAKADEHLDRCEKCRKLVACLACDVSTPNADDLPPPAPPKPRHASTLAVGTVLADRYLVLEMVGMGGMGMVYAAYDRQLDRKIAIKLVRAEHGSPEQLVKEARSLARLTHPNVVVVHDVGEALGEAYMAMEYVNGATLRRWQQDERPSSNRVLEVYLDAAKGLAAAHAAGLVHRDVKPDNILLGDDGRVRIMDFGLARAEHMAPIATIPTEAPGTMLEGTWPYMAPERFQGSPADARSDQFAFCISLYEALYGEHPFDFAKFTDLPAAVLQGRLRNPPRTTTVDRAVRAVLLRGLATDPAMRFPSMDDLANALRSVMRRKRIRTLTAVASAAVVMLAGAIATVAPAPTPPPCAGSERLLADIWDAPRRTAIDKAIRDTGLVYAPNTSRTVQEALDQYAERWVATHTAACQATRVHGEQSEEVLGLRMACLGTRLSGLRALTDGLKQADKRAVEKAVEATQQLGAPELCDEVHVIAESFPPPDATTDVQVKALRERLAKVEAFWYLGHEAEALEGAKAITQEAESVRYPAIQAEAGFWLGRLMTGRTDAAARERTLFRALHAAEASSQDRVGMELWIELAKHALWATAHYDEAIRSVEHAEAHATRLGDETVAVRLLVIRTGIYRGQNKHTEALGAAQDAVSRCEITPRCVKAYLHRALVQLAIMRGITGDVEGALKTFDRSMALAEPMLGREHPFIASLLNDRATVLIRNDRHKEAVPTLRRAITIAEQTGMGEGFLGFLLENYGEVLVRTGDYEGALDALQRSIAVKNKVVGHDDPGTLSAHSLVGDALVALKRGDEALAAYQQGFQFNAKSSKPNPDVRTMEQARKNLEACGAPCSNALGKLDAQVKERKP